MPEARTVGFLSFRFVKVVFSRLLFTVVLLPDLFSGYFMFFVEIKFRA